MPFDYLLNHETAEKSEKLRQQVVSDPDALSKQCRISLKCAENAWLALQDAFEQAAQNRRAELDAFCAEVNRATSEFPVSASVFRRADPARFDRICAFIRRLETRQRTLTARTADFGDLERMELHCKAAVLQTRHLLSSVKAVSAGHALYGACCKMEERVEVIERDLVALHTRMSKMRLSWAEFCGKRLPQFLNDLSNASDLLHNGADCDGERVRRLCGEICFAAGKIE